MKHAKNNDEAPMSEDVKFGEGKTPVKARWPFAELKKGKFFEVHDVTKHIALRTAASRARKKLSRTFAVRKVTREDGEVVIRVYRQ